MRAVIQRVLSASVTVEGEVLGAIARGLVVLIGKEEADDAADIEWLIRHVQRMVYQMKGVYLATEVRIVGEEA